MAVVPSSSSTSDNEQGSVVVFADAKNFEPEVKPDAPPACTDDLPKPIMATKGDVNREDDGIPIRWAGHTLPPTRALIRRLAHLPSRVPVFNVYEGAEDVVSAQKL